MPFEAIRKFVDFNIKPIHVISFRIRLCRERLRVSQNTSHVTNKMEYHTNDTSYIGYVESVFACHKTHHMSQIKWNTIRMIRVILVM